MKTFCGMVFGLTLLSSPLCLAQSNPLPFGFEPYVGGQLASQHLNVKSYGSHNSGTFGSAALVVGANINAFMAIEARYGRSFNNIDIDGEDVKFKRYYGGYLKLGLPTKTIITPYVIAGRTWGKIDDHLSGVGTYTLKGHDDSYGAGLQLAIARHSAVNIEYMKLYDKDDIRINQVAMTVSYVF